MQTKWKSMEILLISNKLQNRIQYVSSSWLLFSKPIYYTNSFCWTCRGTSVIEMMLLSSFFKYHPHIVSQYKLSSVMWPFPIEIFMFVQIQKTKPTPVFPGIRCIGHDIKRYHNTIEECKKECDSHPDCVAFVHSDDESRGFCMLKNDTCLDFLVPMPGLTMFAKSGCTSKIHLS